MLNLQHEFHFILLLPNKEMHRFFISFFLLGCLSINLVLSYQVSPASIKSNLINSLLKKGNVIVSTGVLLTSFPTVAYVMSEQERSLQQNQRPDALDATVTRNNNAPNYENVRSDIEAIIKEKPDKGPTFVRLAWHSSGTYDKMLKDGGSGKGTIRFKEELAHGANAGLEFPTTWLDPIYKKYNKKTDLSYADLYTLAGVVAIKTLGGPDVKWRAGRLDSYDPADVTPDGRLPEADKGSPMKT